MNRSRDCNDLMKEYELVKKRIGKLTKDHEPYEDSVFSIETGRILSDMVGSIISFKSSVSDEIEKKNKNEYSESKDLLIDYLKLIETYQPFRSHEMRSDFGYRGLDLEPFDEYVKNASIEMQRFN